MKCALDGRCGKLFLITDANNFDKSSNILSNIFS